jgi:aspartate/methionine/tyrosine aminotransferase
MPGDGDQLPEPHRRADAGRQQKRLLQLARRHGLTIIEDDVFGELYFGSQHPARSRPGTVTAT